MKKGCGLVHGCQSLLSLTALASSELSLAGFQNEQAPWQCVGDGFPGYPLDNTDLNILDLVSWDACGGLTVPYFISAPGVSAPSEATQNLGAASQSVVAPH